VDGLIGPATVNTLPEPLIAAFEDHGSVSRTVDLEPEHAAAVLADLGRVGVDMESVGMTLEDHGVASFHESLAHVLDTLTTKLRLLERR
jgi:transaldolase